ncbi:alkaline phosphatase family protein [Neoroseomonas soli]|uniref:Sulfatase N-terminal domain-containing protein n=1 Tax=Neoroseomonas soli TaxID=1081025 RepID=A0A9X9WY29_9PROT|nr:hypothetical protein [Neoroseomonas soli]MBR0672058.1 hypothetical protein [Neoroseomonas soli]
MTLPDRGRGSRLAGHPEIVALLAGVLLPNAVHLLGIAADVGVPLRTPAFFLYLWVVLLARRLPFAVACGTYLLVLAADIVWTLSATFHLTPLGILQALKFTSELNLAASPLYLALIAGVASSTTTSLLLLARHREALRQASLVPALLATLALAGGDVWTYATGNVSFLTLRSAPAELDSAARRSGFEQAVLAPGQRNALLVVVESLGAFADPAHRELVLSAFGSRRLRAAYEVTSGTVPYFGATTSGELRELCRSSQSYTTLTAEAARDCLPRRLAEAGRRTVALHAYTGQMFDRRDWYPLLGFQRMLFAEEMADTLHNRCGGVFTGLCDTEIGASLPRLLPPRPEGRFTYWLTLNTHAPIRPGDSQPRFGCDDGGGPFGQKEICLMAELWADLMETVAAVALDARTQPLEVLIVGDHAPALWSRRARALFRPGEVSWVRLAPRG